MLPFEGYPKGIRRVRSVAVVEQDAKGSCNDNSQRRWSKVLRKLYCTPREVPLRVPFKGWLAMLSIICCIVHKVQFNMITLLQSVEKEPVWRLLTAHGCWDDAKCAPPYHPQHLQSACLNWPSSHITTVLYATMYPCTGVPNHMIATIIFGSYTSGNCFYVSFYRMHFKHLSQLWLLASVFLPFLQYSNHTLPPVIPVPFADLSPSPL